MQQGVELEYRYAEDTMPRGVLGLNAAMSRNICVSSRTRCQQIGIDAIYPGAENPSRG